MSIPADVRAAFAENARYFGTPIQLVQFLDKYARWLPAKRRRETWPEAVKRVVDYLDELSDYKLPSATIAEIHTAILEMRIMPSMRLLAMAGEPARRNNIAIYNCAAAGVDHVYSFVESLIISMAGAGSGFSVESQFVRQLPTVGCELKVGESILGVLGEIPLGSEGPIVSDVARAQIQAIAECSRHEPRAKYVHVVRDSSEGWAEALALGLAVWWAGKDWIEFDVSQVRPKGTPLVTKGGTASGPEPLVEMLAAIRATLLGARGRKLRPLEAHDIKCKIADCVVSGGVRRSAMISLFDFDDDAMRECKPFGFWDDPRLVSRKNANNSAVWPDRHLERFEVARIMNDMFDRGTGEPGIFSRGNAWRTSPARRRALLNLDDRFLTNPCGEIYLRNGQFCNLSIVVARPGMTRDDFARLTRLATIVGTIQSCATHFPGLRPKWKANSEAERLLGVDIMGQADFGYLPDALLADLKQVAIDVNRETASKLGIQASAAITCVKPGGNSAVLLNCSSGMGRPWSTYRIRRMTLEKGGVMARVLEASGWELEASCYSDRHVHALFPMHSPGLTRQDETALDQCRAWLSNKLHWTEHNPSCTITYREHEREGLIDWIHEHQSIIGGMAFLPASDDTYPQAPNETISREQFEAMSSKLPAIDAAWLWEFEDRDTTTSAREVACSAGACDLV